MDESSTLDVGLHVDEESIDITVAEPGCDSALVYARPADADGFAKQGGRPPATLHKPITQRVFPELPHSG
jgi:hypothetical protein